MLSALFGGDKSTQADDEIAYLWPCNTEAWRHWAGVQTQWRYSGMGTATGLDYAGVSAYLTEQELPSDTRRIIFAGIQAAERGTLRANSEKDSNK